MPCANQGGRNQAFRVIFDPEAESLVDMAGSPVERPKMSSSVEQSLSPDSDSDDEGRRVEVAFWESVQASDDPAEYLLNLKRFSAGQFAELAGERLENRTRSRHRTRLLEDGTKYR